MTGRVRAGTVEFPGGEEEVAAVGSYIYILGRKIRHVRPGIQKLENQFPAISGSAFAAAREQVLASGQSVLQSENGSIYEVFPDGRRVLVKKIEPPTRVNAGSVFTIP